VAARALQVHGSLGVSHEMPFAGMVLESFHMGFADGPTEVHKLSLARQVLKDHRPSDDLFPTAHIPRLRALARERYADALAELDAM
jgi:acyl-CoA dehydrogenase